METKIVFLAHQPGSEWLPGLDLYRVVEKATSIHLWGPNTRASCRAYERLAAAAGTEEGRRRLHDWAAEHGGINPSDGEA